MLVVRIAALASAEVQTAFLAPLAVLLDEVTMAYALGRNVK